MGESRERLLARSSRSAPVKLFELVGDKNIDAIAIEIAKDDHIALTRLDVRQRAVGEQRNGDRRPLIQLVDDARHAWHHLWILYARIDSWPPRYTTDNDC
jgi:hypothetical protein